MMDKKIKRKKVFSVWKYVKNYRFNSLFIKNMILILTLIIIPLLLVSFVSYFYSGRILVDEIKTANTRSLHKVHGTVDMIQSEVDRMSIHFANDADVLRLMNSVKSEYPDYQDIEMLINIIDESVFLSKDYIDSVYVYSRLNKYLLTPGGGGDLDKWKDQFWLQAYNNMPDDTTTMYALTTPQSTTSRDTHLLSYYRQPTQNQAINSGVVIINISINSIVELLSDTLEQDNEIVFILNGDNEIMFSTEIDWIGQHIDNVFIDNDWSQITSDEDILLHYNDDSYILTQLPSDFNGWMYCSILPKSDFYDKQVDLRNLMILAMAILLPITILASYLLSVRVFRPIDEVIDMLENPTEIPGYEDSDSELKMIAGNIMRSYDEHQQNEIEINKRINMLNNARVRALQAQINPHFLHNTLQAINWLILKETGNEDSEAIEALEELASLVRVNMETKKNMTRLEDELEYVKKYINIQKIRYGDKINLDIHVLNEHLDTVILKMSLQPLIENSIYHGLKQIDGPGHISIMVKSHDDYMIITVEDNGIGMDEESMIKINTKLASAEALEDNHIGLNNVNLRLKLVFGPQSSIVLSHARVRGTITKMIIPRHRMINIQDKY